MIESDDLPAPSVQELAQLKALAARLSDLDPVLTEDGFDTEIVVTFDDYSSVSASVHEGHFGFGTSFTFEDGGGFSDAFGYVPLANLAEAEEEVRSTFRDMPQLRAEAAEDYETGEEA